MKITFATLTQDNQLKLLHYFVKHGTVLPSQKDDCHPILAEFRNDHFYILNKDKRKNIMLKPLYSFPLKLLSQFKFKIENQSRIVKTLLQQLTNFKDTHITDNDDSIEKRYHRMMINFPDLSLINNLSTSENYNDSGNKK